MQQNKAQLELELLATQVQKESAKAACFASLAGILAWSSGVIKSEFKEWKKGK